MLLGSCDEKAEAVEKAARADPNGFVRNGLERDGLDKLGGGGGSFQFHGDFRVGVFCVRHGGFEPRMERFARFDITRELVRMQDIRLNARNSIHPASLKNLMRPDTARAQSWLQP